MRRHRPQLLTRSARLSEQFGYDYAVRLFGREAIESLPLLKAGPNRGKTAGTLRWRVAMSAGYVPECCGPCKEGGLVDAWVGESRDTATTGLWCGRVQGLAGSRSVLTAEYREQEARRQAAYAAELAELRAGRG